MAVAVLLGVIAVVEAEDVSGCVFVRGGIFFSAFGDAIHARDEPLFRLRFPVVGDYRPHHGLHVHTIGGGNDPRIAQAVGRAEPPRRHAGGLPYGVAALLQMDFDLRGCAFEKVWVIIGVISDAVAAGGRLAQQIRGLSDEIADYKKCGAGVVAGEKVQEFRRDCGVGSVVEGDG